MNNQPTVIQNKTEVFYTVEVNDSLFVSDFNLNKGSVTISNGTTKYNHIPKEKPVEFLTERDLKIAKEVAKLCGGKIKKHIIHTLSTETIEEVNINE